MFLDFFREGGWGMYPTLLFGTVTAAMAFRFAAKPDHGITRALWTMGAATIFSGLLGFFTGTIRTFQYVQKLPPPEQFSITLVGLSESMCNLVLAFVMTMVALILLSIGSLRQSKAGFA